MKNYLSLLCLVGFVGCGSSDVPSVVTPESSSATVSQEASGAESTPVAFNAGDLPTVKLVVPGIHCEFCAANVKETLAGVDGVKEIQIDVDTKTATVAVDQTAFDSEKAITALADANFADTTLEGTTLEGTEKSVQ